jgi:ectoine hydroxylase-related dioxygenase (phytanoyl-CoA dioxygenase family)
MAVHSDLAIVIPEPWHAPWSVNVIWCLDDVYADNGATLYLPGSHRFERAKDLPANPKQAMVPFEAEAGSIIIMEGAAMAHIRREPNPSARQGLTVWLLRPLVYTASVEFQCGLGRDNQGPVKP